MNYYAMTIAYEGTDYCGWQFQPNCPTITGIIQRTFFEVFNQQAIIVGASRTDSGVHAVGQVAVCRTMITIDPERLRIALNNRLPATILIRRIQKVDYSFHPQRNVEQKTYLYHFFVERPLPLVQRYGWHFRYPIDFDKLRESFTVFTGTHDFRSFCTGDERKDDTIRTIDSLSVDYLPRYRVYQIVVRGKSFLRYMIRRIVGASLEIACRPELSVDDLRLILAAKNPEHLLPNAPSKGLMLYKIHYKTEDKNG
jgi:tRNA pseudouridine38-40 synthase